jgi:hypothetical protein
MNPKKKVAFAVTLGSALAVVLAMASVAIATHVHPASTGALKDSFALVPAFKKCSSPDSRAGR